MSSHRYYRGKDATYDGHDHEGMADVLLEAEAIKADKGVMKGVQKHLKGKMKAITSIQGLRDKLSGKVAGGDKLPDSAGVNNKSLGEG